MRVKFLGENLMPEVRSICTMKCAESYKDSVFFIYFDNIIRAEIPMNANNIEAVYKDYQAVINALFLNGYVNLCLGEFNCPLSLNGWRVSPLTITKLGIGA